MVLVLATIEAMDWVVEAVQEEAEDEDLKSQQLLVVGLLAEAEVTLPLGLGLGGGRDAADEAEGLGVEVWSPLWLSFAVPTSANRQCEAML